jgi:large subunit ribosomal protein L1
MASKQQETTKPADEASKNAADAAGANVAQSQTAGEISAPVAGATTAEAAARKRKKPGKSPRRGKKLKNHLRNVRAKLQREGAMPLRKAVATLKSLKRSKMDETVEIHMHLGVDATQSDQLVRGSVSLPHGVGRAVRVVVFCQADNVAKAKAAGADFAGGDDLIEKIQKENWLDFDVALATQDMMGKVSRLGKVLGPRGLMPTPKAGTVLSATQDVAEAVREFKAGKVEYRTDKTGNVHARVGKMSFEDDKLVENIQVFIDQIKSAKPSGVRGQYILSAWLSATQSPGIQITV